MCLLCALGDKKTPVLSTERQNRSVYCWSVDLNNQYQGLYFIFSSLNRRRCFVNFSLSVRFAWLKIGIFGWIKWWRCWSCKKFFERVIIDLRREISSFSKVIKQLICSIFHPHRAVMGHNYSLSRVSISKIVGYALLNQCVSASTCKGARKWQHQRQMMSM